MLREDREDVTSVWRDFEKGRMYNKTKNLYKDTEQNYDFYYGNQAKYLNIGKETPVILNIIKSIVKYKLGVVNSNAYAIVYNPNFYNAQNEAEVTKALCDALSKHANEIWELQQVGTKIKEVVKDACINDEGIAHAYYDTVKQEEVTEVIDKNNIYYGNENDSDIQTQPYIIISYRKPITEVRKEAESLGIDREKIEQINADGETLEQAGYSSVTDEVNPMCLVLLKYYKQNGQVYYTKAVKAVELETNVPTGLKLYPVAHMNWEKVKGSARGVGAVRNTIPNQIEINKIATRRSISVKISAFPKLAVNDEFVINKSALEKVGSTIKLKGGAQIDDVRKQIGYLNPASMSPDAKNLQDDLQNTTKDLEGAGDVATGSVDPTQASGKAILAVQQATQQPLNEQVDTYKTFIEDLARIYFDMWKAYKVNGLRILVEQKDEDGKIIEVPTTITYEQLKALEANIKIDITPRSPFDIYAQEQSIANLLMNGFINFEEYVELLPDGSSMQKDDLQAIIDRRKENEKKIAQMEMEANELNSAINMVMGEEERNGNDEMSRMQTSGNASEGNQEQPSNIPMSQMQ